MNEKMEGKMRIFSDTQVKEMIMKEQLRKGQKPSYFRNRSLEKVLNEIHTGYPVLGGSIIPPDSPQTRR